MCKNPVVITNILEKMTSLNLSYFMVTMFKAIPRLKLRNKVVVQEINFALNNQIFNLDLNSK